MKILIIGENNSNSLETIYRKNFLELNCSTVKIISYFIPKQYFIKKIINFFEKYFFYLYCLIQNYFLIKKFKRDKHSYDLVIVFNGYYLFEKTILNLKKKSKLSLINIQTDNIFKKKNILLKKIKIFDKIYVWSKKLKKEIQYKTAINKKKIFYLPFGYDQFLFKKKLRTKKLDKILFYGSWDLKREELLSNINHKILKIYGNGWEKAKKNFRSKYDIKAELIGTKLVNEISNSLVCLNFFRDQAKDTMNMRSFEVIAYGGNLLSEYSLDQKSYFKNFKGIFYFKNISQVNTNYEKLIMIKQNLLKTREHNLKKIKNDSYLNRAQFILKNERTKKAK